MRAAAPGDLRAWTPVHVGAFEQPPSIEWARLPAGPFTDPFFTQTVMRAMQRPFNLAFRRRTPIEVIEAFAESGEGVPLRGVIYHMSRSGSTLIARMLAALSRNVVLSEPAPLSQVLRLRTQLPDLDEDRHVRLVRGIVGALLRPRSPGACEGFIKLATTDVLHAPLMQRAFPGVPAIFSFRHPLEVLASQVNQVGTDVVPGALPLAVLRIDPAAAAAFSFEEWIAHSLAAVCRAALRLDDCGFVDYASLPEAVVSALPGFFGVTYGAEERDRMIGAAAVDAKAPHRRFEPDSEQKRRSIPFAMREAAELLVPLYEEMRCRSAMMFPSESIA